MTFTVCIYCIVHEVLSFLCYEEIYFLHIVYLHYVMLLETVFNFLLPLEEEGLIDSIANQEGSF